MLTSHCALVHWDGEAAHLLRASPVETRLKSTARVHHIMTAVLLTPLAGVVPNAGPKFCGPDFLCVQWRSCNADEHHAGGCTL